MTRRTDLNGVSSLWRKYKKTNDVVFRNKLVEEYLKLVKYNAERLKAKLPKTVELDDLVSAGVFGLMDAIEAFDLSRGVKFETYCVPRIRGAMLDELRTTDWVPRLVRSQTTKYLRAMEGIKHHNGNGNGHVPTLQEIADYLEVSVEEAKRIEDQGNAPIVHVCRMVGMPRGEDGESEFKGSGLVDSNQLQDTKTLRPEEELSKDSGFLELISCLPDEEQIIVTLYHRDEFEMWKIGKILGLSESRVSQMHSSALQKIKDSVVL
jgi:RNA polymerase sigma factor for flagellar operon FliA